MTCMRQVCLILALLLTGSVLRAQTLKFDVVITGGRIADGTADPWYYADVGIIGDRIAAIGKLAPLPARKRIDARGLTVAPGFIDIHSHGRRGLLEVPGAENYIRQGVTTIIDGQDGGSPIPLGPYLAEVAKAHFAVNFGMLAGQGSIRQVVIGLENRSATPAEIHKMKDLAHQAMLDGAFGISTGLFYIPGAYTPAEEIIELAKVVGQMGGIHISHMRDEAGGLLDSVRETIRIGEEGGLPTQLTHHKVIGKENWGGSAETLSVVAAARARGVDVTIDQYPYTASSTGTAAMFPQWAQEGGQKGLLARLADPSQRARIKQDVIRRLRYDRGGGDPKNVVLVACPFDESLAGKSLADVAALQGRPATFENAAETAIELQQRGGCAAIYHAMSEEDVERIMASPYTMIASDGGIPVFGEYMPHPRMYGTFARVLGRYSRNQGLFRLEEAVRKMSSLPAARLGLMDRGVLRPEMKADLAVFDAAKVIDRAEFLNPHQYAEGVRHVFVNGEAVLLDGKMTGVLPGRVLYGPAKQ